MPGPIGVAMTAKSMMIKTYNDNNDDDIEDDDEAVPVARIRQGSTRQNPMKNQEKKQKKKEIEKEKKLYIHKTKEKNEVDGILRMAQYPVQVTRPLKHYQ